MLAGNPSGLVERALVFAKAAHESIDQRRKYTGEPYVKISLTSSPREQLYLWNHEGNTHEHLGKHVVVIRDSAEFVVRLFSLVDKTN